MYLDGPTGTAAENRRLAQRVAELEAMVALQAQGQARFAESVAQQLMIALEFWTTTAANPQHSRHHQACQLLAAFATAHERAMAAGRGIVVPPNGRAG